LVTDVRHCSIKYKNQKSKMESLSQNHENRLIFVFCADAEKSLVLLRIINADHLVETVPSLLALEQVKDSFKDVFNDILKE
jgi:hypothetical protein